MISGSRRRVLVAHRRAPVERMIRTNLEAEGIGVLNAPSPAACLSTLRGRDVDALVLDADLVRGDAPESAELLRYLLGRTVPTLLVSWEPSDWLLARSLHDAPFVSRPDDIEQVIGHVQVLLAEAAERSDVARSRG